MLAQALAALDDPDTRLAVTELRSEEGEVTGYLGVAVDTTAAVEMRRELKEAQALWRLSMDHLPDTAVLVRA